MIKLVFDSDGLIKLTKAGCIEKILENFTCLISTEVYEETIVKGKDRMYDDAFTLDKFVRDRRLHLEKTMPNEAAQNILANSTIGNGERLTLHLFFNVNAKAIISDHRAFLNLLQRNNEPFVIPTDLIVRLYQLKIISRNESIEALKMIKPLTNKNNYAKSMEELEE